MVQIKTYDDFMKVKAELYDAVWQVRYRDNEIEKIMKDYVLAPDFDKKRLLAYQVNFDSDAEYVLVRQLLKNTLAQYKKKSDRLKFVEDCLRDFGENNLQYYDSQSPMARFTGNEENIFNLNRYYPEYLGYMLGEAFEDPKKPKFKSLDAQIVWALLGHDKKINLKTGQHFDADSPLHRKLAAITMQIEKQTRGGLFKGITERWEQDTAETQKTHLEQSQDEAIRGHRHNMSDVEVDILKQIKRGEKVPVEAILDLSEASFQEIMPSDLAGLDVSDIYKICTKGLHKATDTQARAILELLIKSAPVDRDWYKRLARKIMSGKHRDDYKLLNLFDKRFGKVAEGIQEDLKTSRADKEKKEKEYSKIRDEQADVDKRRKALEQTQDIFGRTIKKNNDLLSEFKSLTKSDSEAERDFYSRYYQKLLNYNNALVSGNSENYVYDVTEITGHPWKVFGNKEEKHRLETARRIFDSLLSSCKNPPKPWGAEEDTELRALKERALKLYGDESSARGKLNQLRDRIDDLSRDEDTVYHFSWALEEARTEYLKKIQSAEETFKSKYGRAPKVPVLKNAREK